MIYKICIYLLDELISYSINFNRPDKFYETNVISTKITINNYNQFLKKNHFYQHQKQNNIMMYNDETSTMNPFEVVAINNRISHDKSSHSGNLDRERIVL